MPHIVDKHSANLRSRSNLPAVPSAALAPVSAASLEVRAAAREGAR